MKKTADLEITPNLTKKVKFNFTMQDILINNRRNLISYIVFNKETKEFECWQKTTNDVFTFDEPYLFIDKFDLRCYPYEYTEKAKMNALKRVWLDVVTLEYGIKI
ncbi:hypothetical protein OFO01_07255 [Campylobacter sp. JMF_01 NE2]|uniref:hypothetical protein n=1 Tax=unclassified Campylobacter TaxID=2593542 RepID=UPI0022E9D8CE|nr:MULTISPECIES: hypothetical protein [unclassified Campylobacter]MDA3053239.1 hypothetical protein [Campylobacter sp. JMF_03 NE3]MDA3067578.1 hypothetical protein [Campylobacter sp. JMF_01 NE2]